MADQVTDFLTTPRAFVRVYRLPEKLTDGYCFGRDVPIVFANVDWFEAPIAEGRAQLEAFIRGKRYFAANARYLVLADHPDLTFTIGMEPTNA